MEEKDMLSLIDNLQIMASSQALLIKELQERVKELEDEVYKNEK